MEADPESTESTPPGEASKKNRTQDYNILVKNPTETMEMCEKCERKIINGVRCKSCLRAIHWKCGGITKDNVKVDKLNRNGWDCAFAEIQIRIAQCGKRRTRRL